MGSADIASGHRILWFTRRLGQLDELLPVLWLSRHGAHLRLVDDLTIDQSWGRTNRHIGDSWTSVGIPSQEAQTSPGDALNIALRDAISRSGATRTGLARRVGVTKKTVERWLSDPSRVPHQQTRDDVAEVLGVSADVLWPKAIRSSMKTGPDREIVAAYPYRNACPTSVWARLIDGASTSITFAGYTNYFVWQEHPRLPARLSAKVASGCSVRFLVGDPDSEITRRREEIEESPSPWEHASASPWMP